MAVVISDSTSSTDSARYLKCFIGNSFTDFV